MAQVYNFVYRSPENMQNKNSIFYLRFYETYLYIFSDLALIHLTSLIGETYKIINIL